MKHRQRRNPVLGDAELARAAKGGDAVSLGILLERHRAPLHALALRMLGHGPEAQDAVQDAFVVALGAIDRLREPEAVGGWLRAILRNVCLMRLRERRGESTFDELSPRFKDGSAEASAERYIDRMATREWVWAALSELPESLRVTAMLRYFGSYPSYQEISAILGVPVGTVSSRLTQVKVKLAEALLKTAGLEHDEARRLAESQTRFFAEAFDGLNRKGNLEMFASAFSDNLVWAAIPEGAVRRGLATLVHVFGADLEYGVRMAITNILASKGVIVIEGDQVNPPEDPLHCPPAISMVGFHRDGRINLLHTYEPPRPETDQHG